VGRDLGPGRGPVWRAGIRRGPHLGSDNPQRGVGIPLSVRVFVRHDGATGRGRILLRRDRRVAARRRVDVVDQKGRWRGSLANGGILFRQSGPSMVKTCVVRRASYVGLLLLTPALLRAQDVIVIPVGETPPAVTLENLNGDSVALSQWIGKKPVIVEFWATWCRICAELLPRVEAAQRKYRRRAAFLLRAVPVDKSQS